MTFSKALFAGFCLSIIALVALLSILNLDLIGLSSHQRGGLLSHRSIRDEYTRRDPVIKTLRCDACLRIATIFDAVLDVADSQYPGEEELKDSEVQNIVSRVCSRRTFRKMGVLEVDGLSRLKFKPEEGTKEWNEINWSQRLKNHCLYLSTNRLSPSELYDMWLRVSAGSSVGFEQFLCYGEGPFSDCTEPKDDSNWPGGDEMKEGDIEEPYDEDDLDDLIWEDYYLSSSASKKSNFLSFF